MLELRQKSKNLENTIISLKDQLNVVKTEEPKYDELKIVNEYNEKIRQLEKNYLLVIQEKESQHQQLIQQLNNQHSKNVQNFNFF